MLRGAYCIWERDLKVFSRNLLPELITVVAFPTGIDLYDRSYGGL